MAERARREKMSSVDTAWLRMDRPHNLMMICGVMIFDGPLAFERLRRLVEERFLVFRRFRQCADRAARLHGLGERRRTSTSTGTSSTSRCRGARGKRELQALVSRLVATPLDPARPMWQFHLVEHYNGGSALVMRIHHCYADGIALVSVMLSMTDAARDGPPAMPFAPRPRTRKARRRLAGRQLMQPFSGVLQDRA